MPTLLALSEKYGARDQISYGRHLVTGKNLADMMNNDYKWEDNKATGQVTCKAIVGVISEPFTHLLSRVAVEETKNIAHNDGTKEFLLQLICTDEAMFNRGIVNESTMFLYNISSGFGGVKCFMRYLYHEDGQEIPIYFIDFYDNSPITIAPLSFGDNIEGKAKYFYDKAKHIYSQLYKN
ncbi:hypothetical protein NST74_29405 [Paenibacillus sp. FSL F4-0125]|uniref:hypothetical protein n=1 Tax=Paenibacillus sp. FSL F4-0125 TaxID=2954730 RepID=UPI0030F79225